MLWPFLSFVWVSHCTFRLKLGNYLRLLEQLAKLIGFLAEFELQIFEFLLLVFCDIDYSITELCQFMVLEV